jgi:hypothetical protein
MLNRRADQDRRPYFVDRVSGREFAAGVLVLFLTLVDGFLTLALLDSGFEEANPLLRYLLDRDPGLFFLGKYALTAAFLPVALVLRRPVSGDLPAWVYPDRPEDARLRGEQSPSRRFGTVGPLPWTNPANASIL